MNGLVASSRRSAQRSALVASRVPRGLTPTAVVAVVGVVFVLIWGQQYTGSVFVLAACYAIVTAGMAVQIGFSQQIAFSQSVFMGVGAYGVAMLNTHYNMPVLIATPIVLVGSALLAILLGSVVTRASGLALAVATLMLPLIAVGYVSGTGFLGGAVGAPLPGTLWPSSSASTTVALVGGGLIVIALLALAVFIAARILTSDIGLELFVLGVDERTAAALGVRTPRRKLELFVLGCVFAALGGAVYAGTQQFVPETLVDPTAELALLIMLFIGGRRSVIGAVIGAMIIQYLQGASNWVSVNILVVEGLLLTVVLLVDPEGLAGIVTTGIAWLRARLGSAPATGAAQPAEAAGLDSAGRPATGRTTPDRRRRPGRESPGRPAAPRPARDGATGAASAAIGAERTRGASAAATRRRRCLRSGPSSRSTAGSACSRTSPSRSPSAACSRSAARTARASPPCSTSSAAASRRPAARSSSAAPTSPGGRRTSGSTRASAGPSSPST